VKVYNSDDSTGNVQELYQFSNAARGTIERNTAVYRTGGAVKSTVGFSSKYVTTADVTKYEHLQVSEIITNVASTGSKTFTLHLIHDSLTNLQDDEVYMELSYFANSADTEMTTVSTSWNNADPGATPADLTASTESWTEVMTNPNKQKMTSTVTVNQAGPVMIRVFVAKASYTVYVCPKIEVA